MLWMRAFVVSVCIDQFLALRNSKPNAEYSSLYYHAKTCPVMLCSYHAFCSIICTVLLDRCLVSIVLCSSGSEAITELISNVWNPYLVKDVKLTEGVQRRSTKMVKGSQHWKYDDRLKYLGLMRLERRRVRSDLNELFL